MANSDDIFSWFSETYEEDADQFIYITDVFDDFKESKYYDGLSRADKSKIKKSVFNGKYPRICF
jgi:hypothetical protein